MDADDTRAEAKNSEAAVTQGRTNAFAKMEPKERAALRLAMRLQADMNRDQRYPIPGEIFQAVVTLIVKEYGWTPPAYDNWWTSVDNAKHLEAQYGKGPEEPAWSGHHLEMDCQGGDDA